jgi:hypothetical protein
MCGFDSAHHQGAAHHQEAVHKAHICSEQLKHAGLAKHACTGPALRSGSTALDHHHVTTDNSTFPQVSPCNIPAGSASNPLFVQVLSSHRQAHHHAVHEPGSLVHTAAHPEPCAVSLDSHKPRRQTGHTTNTTLCHSPQTRLQLSCSTNPRLQTRTGTTRLISAQRPPPCALRSFTMFSGPAVLLVWQYSRQPNSRVCQQKQHISQMRAHVLRRRMALPAHVQ